MQPNAMANAVRRAIAGLREWAPDRPAWLHRAMVPRPSGRVRTDSLARLKGEQMGPVSTGWGFERGTPVDRVYIERFLERNRGWIRGRGLEVKDDGYLRAFGDSRVSEFHVVDVDEGNPKATIHADIEAPGSLPREAYDCIVMTQTLHYIFDVHSAMSNCYSALAPGGTLLLTVPGVQKYDPEPNDYWRFTGAALPKLVERTCPGAESECFWFGNLPISIASLQGLAVEDVAAAELEHQDELFPLILAARVTRPQPGSHAHG